MATKHLKNKLRNKQERLEKKLHQTGILPKVHRNLNYEGKKVRDYVSKEYNLVASVWTPDHRRHDFKLGNRFAPSVAQADPKTSTLKLVSSEGVVEETLTFTELPKLYIWLLRYHSSLVSFADYGLRKGYLDKANRANALAKQVECVLAIVQPYIKEMLDNA